MKKSVALFSVGLLSGVILATSNSSFAASTMQKVQAYITNVPVYMDGVAINLDSKPISYNNKTYVPLSDTGKLFGADVKWNSKNKSIEIKNESTTSEATAQPDASNDTIKSLQTQYPAITTPEFDLATGDFGFTGSSDYNDTTATGSYVFTNRDYAVYMLVMSSPKEQKLLDQIKNRFVKMYNLTTAPKTITCTYEGQTIAVING